jgi:hypothetical protein
VRLRVVRSPLPPQPPHADEVSRPRRTPPADRLVPFRRNYGESCSAAVRPMSETGQKRGDADCTQGVGSTCGPAWPRARPLRRTARRPFPSGGVGRPPRWTAPKASYKLRDRRWGTRPCGPGQRPPRAAEVGDSHASP